MKQCEERHADGHGEQSIIPFYVTKRNCTINAVLLSELEFPVNRVIFHRESVAVNPEREPDDSHITYAMDLDSEAYMAICLHRFLVPTVVRPRRTLHYLMLADYLFRVQLYQCH